MSAYVQAIRNQFPDKGVLCAQAAAGAVAGLIAWNPRIVAPVIVANIATSLLGSAVNAAAKKFGYAIGDSVNIVNGGMQIVASVGKANLTANLVRQGVVSLLGASVVVPLVGSLFGVTLSVSILATVLFGLIVNGLMEQKSTDTPQAFCYLPAPFLATLAARLAQVRGLIA